ncbi:hypothetical protein [Streptomyces sp. A1277]|uniref:hypothetical protein n=1 Tax=Streptomyces sp. A1277 TaxID=2563103 RepID=UPI0014465132|nr:hypothetical protein [Streptomyces sp. A1277]
MSANDQEAAEQRVQDAVRRHARTRTFEEAEDVISAVLSDPGVQAAREPVEVHAAGDTLTRCIQGGRTRRLAGGADLDLGILGPAQSDDLFHFTARIGDHPNAVPEPIQEMTPQQRLDAIISERTLRAFPPFGATTPCACFSESPSAHLAFLIKLRKVQPWGIVGSRTSLLELGGGAVAYVPDEQYKFFKKLGMDHWAVRVGPTSAWMHEREWRLPLPSGKIKLASVRAILIGDASWRPSLVDTDEWIDGATGEQCQGPAETPYAQPRQDYPALWRESAIWTWNDENESVVKYPPGALC